MARFEPKCLAQSLRNQWHNPNRNSQELNKAIKTANKVLNKEGQSQLATLTKTEEFEWLDVFEKNKKKAQKLQFQINTIEHEIDTLVYELYGLSEKEIAIVEAS